MDFVFKIIKVYVVSIFIFLLAFLFYIMIYQNDYYVGLLNSSYKVLYVDEYPRGRIYDRNMNLLVDNKEVDVLYFKDNSMSEYDKILNIYKFVDHIDIDYIVNSSIIKKFIINKDNNNCNYLITKYEWDMFKNRKLSLKDINKLKEDRISDDVIKKLSDKDLKCSYIYYLINNGYSYEDKVIKKNLSKSEVEFFKNNRFNGFDLKKDYERVYKYKDVFRDILGNISKINYEDKDYYLNRGYSLKDNVGVSFLEKEYESFLRSIKSKYIIKNGRKELVSRGRSGNDLILSIDINLQKEVEDIIYEELVNAKSYGGTSNYNHAYSIISNPKNGEILSISGIGIKYKKGKYIKEDYSHNILTDSFVVGSVVKGASSLVGYKYNAIDINKYMYDDCIKIYSKPRKCSWSKLGSINDIDALAYSSNIYQFKTAMLVDGFDYSYNKKFLVRKSSFDKYRSLFNELGLGVKTGIDLPGETYGYIGKDYSSDLYLNYTIGQYDTYTVLQLSQYINTISNNGIRNKLSLVKDKSLVLNKVNVDKKYISRVQKGFRAVMDYGLGKNYMGNVLNPCGKTGTSETYFNGISTLTNTFIGYYPYNNPKMSIVVVSPNIVTLDGFSGERSYANKRIARRISEKYKEMYE